MHLPFYIAVNINFISNISLNNSLIKIILSSININPHFVVTKLWFLWPLVFGLQFSDLAEFTMNFIIRSSNKDWKTIFVTIDIVAQCLHINTRQFQRIFLKTLAASFLTSQVKSHIKEFIEISLFFILTRPKNSESIAIYNLYRNSPFFEKSGNANEKGERMNDDNALYSPKLFNMSDFFEKMHELSNISNISVSDYKFSLDLDKNGIWLDKELCELIIKIGILNNIKIEAYLAFQNSFKFYFYGNSNDKNVSISNVSCLDLYEIYKSNAYLINCIVSLIPHISLFIIKNQDNSKKLQFFVNIQTIERSKSYLLMKDIETKNREDQSEKQWRLLWRQLIIDRAPWHKSLPQKDQHFKRDCRVLANFYPAKLKRNMNFTEHKDAAFKRDYGSAATAKKLYEEYKTDLEQKYVKDAPPPLLELNDRLLSTSDSKNENNYEISKAEYEGSLLTINGMIDIQFILTKTNCTIVKKKENKAKSIEADDVEYVLFRSFLHHESSFEIITYRRKSYLIYLHKNSSLGLLRTISSLTGWSNTFVQTEPHKPFIKNWNITSAWENGRISNFKYLMLLNFFGGRTFNETSLYPIFPWIIKNFTSDVIDINDESIYRDLSIPMGAQTQDRLQELEKHMKDYATLRNVKFLYNSCYVSPLCVFLWLIRTEPFTTLHIKLQSGKFDYAARVFSSIPSAFNMATSHMNDYRELIPEFFFTSSFLENRDHFDLGKIDDHIVDNVVLPNWSSSAIEFIYIHRKLLESDYVSKHLNEWIDLIFGCKQRGPLAEKAHNTFDPSLYEDVWNSENLNDSDHRGMIEALLQHCGHIPNQLFDDPHPQKKKILIRPILNTSFKQIDELSGCIFAKFFKDPNSKVLNQIKFIFCSQNGKLSCFLFSISSADNKIQYNNIQISNSSSKSNAYLNLNNIYNLVSEPKTSFNLNLSFLTQSSKKKSIAFCPSNNILAIATLRGAIKVYIDLTKEDTFIIHSGKVNCIAVSKHFIVSGGIDTTINIWNIKPDEIYGFQIEHEKTIPSYRDEITCVEISEKYGTIACGTKDGSILLIDNNNMIITNTIDISPEIPVFVKITSGWGFITIYSKKEIPGKNVSFISVYDIDGQFIRKIQIDFTISCWESYKSLDGFDYFAVASKSGFLYFFEAFYLDIQDSKLPRMNSKIISLHYAFKQGLLYVVRENGIICIYSKDDINMERFNRTKFGKLTD